MSIKITVKPSDMKVITRFNKEKKLHEMIKIQEEFIKENMNSGKKSVLWIFSNGGYYNNDLEKEWKDEFEKTARSLFEEQGFQIKGIIIYW